MRRLLPLLMLACLGLVAADGAWAQQGRRPQMPQMGQQPQQSGAMRPEPPRPAPRSSREDSSLSDSVRWAQRNNGGRVIGAERMQSDGREINRIKLMDDEGRVRYVDDDRQPRRGIDRRSPAARDPRGGQSTP